MLSGWCMAPEGARPDHDGCRFPERCGCFCHGPESGSVDRDSAPRPVESDVNEGRFRANGIRPSDRSTLTEKGGGW